MKASDFKYEVAFSFLATDEIIATKLNDSVSDVLKTFIYTDRQKEIVGTNGIDTFSRVFSKEGRMVVLLYRDGWGKTNWTRVEENAITGRIFEEGWDFLLFVKLDNKSTLPPWMTKTHMRFNLEDSSLERLKGVIEYKVAELGGTSSKETLEDYAAKFKRQVDDREFLKSYQHSMQRVSDGLAEVNTLFKTVAWKWDNIKNGLGITIRDTKTSHNYIQIFGGRYNLAFVWSQPAVNSLADARLDIVIQKYVDYSNNPHEQQCHEKYEFNRNEIRQVGWFDDSQVFYRTDDLIDFWIKRFLSFILQS